MVAAALKRGEDVSKCLDWQAWKGWISALAASEWSYCRIPHHCNSSLFASGILCACDSLTVYSLLLDFGVRFSLDCFTIRCFLFYSVLPDLLFTQNQYLEAPQSNRLQAHFCNTLVSIS